MMKYVVSNRTSQHNSAENTVPYNVGQLQQTQYNTVSQNALKDKLQIKAQHF